MPPFQRKSAPPPPAAESTPSPVEASASDRLAVLLAEHDRIGVDLANRRLDREQLMRGGGSLDQIEELDAADRRARLRLQQLAAQLPPLQAAVERERAAANEAAWQARRPALGEAQAELVQAINYLYGALAHAHETHTAATRAGFAERLAREFTRPPPQLVADYPLREYLKAVERRSELSPSVAA